MLLSILFRTDSEKRKRRESQEQIKNIKMKPKERWSNKSSLQQTRHEFSQCVFRTINSCSHFFLNNLNNPITFSWQPKRKVFPYRVYCERFSAQRFSTQTDFLHITFSWIYQIPIYMRSWCEYQHIWEKLLRWARAITKYQYRWCRGFENKKSDRDIIKLRKGIWSGLLTMPCLGAYYCCTIYIWCWDRSTEYIWEREEGERVRFSIYQICWYEDGCFGKSWFSGEYFVLISSRKNYVFAI